MTTGPSVEIDLGAYEGWLFDLDGVLTKTARTHAAAWKATFDGFLASETEATGRPHAPFDAVADYERYIDGVPRADGVRNFVAARGIEIPEGSPDEPRSVQGLATSKNARFRSLLASGGVERFEGAIALVRALRDRGVRRAVVSASENTHAALDAAGLADLFDAVVDGTRVKELGLAGKPAPDSYLEGARALGIAPARAVVVEDALAGVEAGRRGDFGLVVGMNNREGAAREPYARDLLAHGATVVVSDAGLAMALEGGPRRVLAVRVA